MRTRCSKSYCKGHLNESSGHLKRSTCLRSRLGQPAGSARMSQVSVRSTGWIGADVSRLGAVNRLDRHGCLTSRCGHQAGSARMSQVSARSTGRIGADVSRLGAAKRPELYGCLRSRFGPEGRSARMSQVGGAILKSETQNYPTPISSQLGSLASSRG